jgi:hypothetical protein
MKLKIDSDTGHAVLQGGLPVYLHEDGREAPFDAAAAIKQTKSLEAALMAEKIGGHFHRSRMVAEKLSIPADILSASFGDRFKLDGGDIVAYDKAGNKIYSRTRPGEVANFDEALELLINAHPHKDSILKKAGAPPGGDSGGAGNGHARSNTLSRSSFAGLSPNQQMAHVKAGGTVTD